MDEPAFADLPYAEQLMSALRTFMKHADPAGVIHGGSLPQILIQTFKIAANRAQTINGDLKILGFRKSSRSGTRHTHFITPPPSGEITAEDVAKLVALKEKKSPRTTGKAIPSVVTADTSSDIETLLKAIELLEEGARKTREHIETLKSDAKRHSDRADDAEAKATELEGLNTELNRQLEELKQSSSVSDPRVQAIRERYLV